MENADTEHAGDVIDRDRAAIGGAAGLLAGLSAIMIPGVGAVVAAGWVGTALTGVVAGTAVGGVVAALRSRCQR